MITWNAAMQKRSTLRNKNRPKERKPMSAEPTASKGASTNVAAPASSAAADVAAPASSVAAGQRGQQPATIRYVDRPDMEETFADSVNGVIFDGQVLRMEFGITRFDEVKASAPLTGRRYPSCRLVLPPAAAVDLINRMQQIAAALTQAGVVKATPRAGDEAAKAD
jgi:hypothetical protein